MAGQVVAPFLLTALLFGLLRRSAPAAGHHRILRRYVHPGTGSDRAGGRCQPRYSGVTAYARAKRAQVALSAQWARRAAGTGVAFHAMHPGWVRTPGIARSLPVFSRLMGPVLRTPEQGADTIVWLASADPARLGTGRFWHDRRLRPVNRTAGARPDRQDAGEQLWEWVAGQAGIDAATPAAEVHSEPSRSWYSPATCG